MPKEWQEKAETEYRKYADPVRANDPERVRFVTHTPRYGTCDWVRIAELETLYEKATVDATRKGRAFEVTTSNVRRLVLHRQGDAPEEHTFTIDGQKVPDPKVYDALFEKVGGKWVDGRDPAVGSDGLDQEAAEQADPGAPVALRGPAQPVGGAVERLLPGRGAEPPSGAHQRFREPDEPVAHRTLSFHGSVRRHRTPRPRRDLRRCARGARRPWPDHRGRRRRA